VLLLKVCIFSCWGLSYTSLIPVTPSFSKSMPHPKSCPLSGSTPTDLHLIPSTHRTHDAKWDAARFSKVWTCSTLKTTNFNCKYIAPRPKAKSSSDGCSHSTAQIFIYRQVRRNFRLNVSSGTILLNRWSRDKCQSANVWWVTLPIQSNPDTASPSLTALKACKQKFLITQCFGLLPPSTYCHTAVRYKSEGRGFDSRWCHWNFSFT